VPRVREGFSTKNWGFVSPKLRYNRFTESKGRIPPVKRGFLSGWSDFRYKISDKSGVCENFAAADHYPAAGLLSSLGKIYSAVCYHRTPQILALPSMIGLVRIFFALFCTYMHSIPALPFPNFVHHFSHSLLLRHYDCQANNLDLLGQRGQARDI